MSSELFQALSRKAGPGRRLDEDAILFRQGDAVRSLYLVTEGTVELARVQEDGRLIVLQRAGTGTVLAEASVYSPTYHCDARAAAPCVVLALPKAVFLAALRDDAGLATLWSASMAREIQRMRVSCEILSRPRVKDRLDGWLTWHDGLLPEKGQWKQLADEIGVSPEALYRELARRRQRTFG